MRINARFYTTLIAFLSLPLISAQAVNVFIVSSNPTDPMSAYLTSNFSNVTSVTINAYQTGAPATSGSDLVIFTRNTNSGDYNTTLAEIDSWNSLTDNILMMSAYVTRGSRFGWFSAEGLSNGTSTAASEATILIPGDSIFNGISGTPADLYNVNGAGANLDASGGTDTLGGGTLLSTIGGNTLIARWNAGAALGNATPNGFSVTQTTHAGKRIFLPSHAGGQLSHFTADGQTVLKNALTEFGLTPIPEPTAAVLLGFGALAVLRRRRRS